MPSDQSRPPQQAWRRNIVPAGKSDGQPKWKASSTAKQPAEAGWSWRTKVGLGVAFVLLVGGSVLWLAQFFIPGRVPYLVSVGADYQENLAIPHNVYGWRAATELSQWADGDSRSFFGGRHRPTPHNAAPRPLDGEWSTLVPTKFRQDTLVLQLSFHGGADEQGPFLFLDDRHGRKHLRIDAVLDYLKSDDLKSKKKLLLLDATQVPAHWQLGMLHNDFALKLAELEPRIREVPDLVVLSASAANQQSWISEERGMTIFGYHALEGLKGAADLDANSHVTALELHQYVSDQVSAWVYTNRLASQTPVLLPSDSEGQQRARQITLAVVNVPYQPSAARKAPDLNGLGTAWKEFENLRQDRLRPEVHSPHRWRLYIDTLLRYEQLVRADGDRADAIQARLASMHKDLTASRNLNLRNCQWNSLALPGTGLSPSIDSALDKQLEELWKDPAKTEVWDAVPRKDSPHVAWQLGKFAVDKLLANESGRTSEGFEKPKSVRDDLHKAGKLLGLLPKDSNYLPAEAHSLAVMLRDLPADSPPPVEDVAAMLALRVLGEEFALAVKDENSGYAYSEQVFPWIRAEIETADHERRLGEDLLISNDSTSWKRASDHRKKAREHYDQSAKLSVAVSAAYQTQNRVLSELPYYTQWIGHRHLHGQDDTTRKSNQRDARELLSLAEKLWAEVHILSSQLEKPDPALVFGKSKSVNGQTELVQTQFDSLVNRFQEFQAKLPKAETPQPWLWIQDALTVPFMSANDRIALLRQSRMISERLNEKTRDTVTQTSDSEAFQEELSWRNADRQYRIGLANLGKRPADALDPKDSGTDNTDSLLRHSKYRAAWGNEIAVHQKRELAGLQSVTDFERRKKQSIEQVAVELRKVEAACRRIDGAAVDQLGKFDNSNDPVTALWRIRVHDLLLWQADRTFADHWFSRDERRDATPYYREAALRYADGAAELVAKEWQKTASDARQKIEKVAQLSFDKAEALDVTKEQVTFDVKAKFRREGQVPAGFPTLWLSDPNKGDTKQKRLKIGNDQDRRDYSSRRERGLLDADRELALTCRISANATAPASPEAIDATAVVEGRYRGQILEGIVPIRLHLQPDVVAHRVVPPDDCGVAVVADDNVFDKFAAKNSAMAIVLDCSGSMDYPKGTRDRFNKAVNALETVLKNVRKDTRVSIWVFGQKETTEPVELKVQRRIGDHEVLIGRIQGTPAAWNPEPAAVKRIVDKIRGLTPWYHTPAVRAMMAARPDVEIAKGFKTLLLITDGDDNIFRLDSELNEGITSIPEFLQKKFNGFRIQVNVVGFELENKDAAIRQFEGVKKLSPLPGRFESVDKAADLARTLEELLAQHLVYRVEHGGRHEVLKDEIRITRLNETPYTEALPESKVFWIHQQDYRQRIRLDPGDVLLLKAKLKGEAVELERFLYTDHLPKTGLVWKSEDIKGWRIGVLQNQTKLDKSQEFLVTLEETSKRDATQAEDLRQVHPEFVWFGVEPEGANQRIALRWRNLPYYPAPTWALEVPGWPTAVDGNATSPVLRCWWRKERPPEPFPLPPKTTAGSLVDRYRNAEAKEHGVTVESVEFVKQQPGFERPGLVIRVKHPPGKPVLARVTDAGKKYETEDRLYRDANRTVTIIWDVTERELDRTDVNLRAISLAEFTADAKPDSVSSRHEDLLRVEAPIPVSQKTRPSPWMRPRGSDGQNK